MRYRFRLPKTPLTTELLGIVKESGAGMIALRAPCHFARRGNEVRLILTSGAQQSQLIPALVRTVTQAKTWYEWIIKGEVCTMR